MLPTAPRQVSHNAVSREFDASVSAKSYFTQHDDDRTAVKRADVVGEYNLPSGGVSNEIP